MRDIRALNPKWHVFIKPFPSRLSSLCKRGGRKIVRARSGRFLQRTESSRHNRTDVNMNSQKLWQHNLHKFKSDKNPYVEKSK